MFSRVFLDAARNELAARFQVHRANGQNSHKGIDLIVNHLHMLQGRLPKLAILHEENPARFYHTRASFNDVLRGLLLVRPNNMQAVYNMLFPPCQEAPRYTHEHIVRLARVLVDTVERDALAAIPVGTPITAGVNTLIQQVVKDLALIHADAMGGEVEEHAPGTEPLEFIGKVRAFGDALESLAPTKKQATAINAIDFILGGTSTVGPELKQELDLMLAGAEESTEDDRELAKGLALSQAMLEDEDADFMRAMANSMKDF
jgi:hypothetical protein